MSAGDVSHAELAAELRAVAASWRAGDQNPVRGRAVLSLARAALAQLPADSDAERFAVLFLDLALGAWSDELVQLGAVSRPFTSADEIDALARALRAGSLAPLADLGGWREQLRDTHGGAQ